MLTKKLSKGSIGVLEALRFSFLDLYLFVAHFTAGLVMLYFMTYCTASVAML